MGNNKAEMEMETKPKKKKGRPSLIDIHKRNLKLQQQQQQQQQQQEKTPRRDSSLRRSARRSYPAVTTSQEDDDNRRQKKLKLSNSNSDGEGNSSPTPANSDKTKIETGSAPPKSDKPIFESNHEDNVGDSGTPLPDKTLLMFILERLQSKDTYGVFSEPVVPEELPDYHEIIDNPMDFLTVTKKLTEGVYGTLEQFEKDVFLICMNGMEYNASDTVYFRQARAIEELAKKSFENLRQDSDDNERTNKTVRRGRPPTKKVNRKPGRPALGRGTSEVSSDTTRSSTKEGVIHFNSDLRKRLLPLENSEWSEISGQFDSSHVESTQNKLDRNRETTGPILKGNFNSLKHLKDGMFVFGEERRSTYMQFVESANGREPPLVTTIHPERKQLMAVGLLTDYGYPRSLARFAANAGPVVWRVASAKVQRSLPPEVKFGPGWVGEDDIPQQRPLPFPSSSSGPESAAPQPSSTPAESCSANDLTS